MEPRERIRRFLKREGEIDSIPWSLFFLVLHPHLHQRFSRSLWPKRGFAILPSTLILRSALHTQMTLTLSTTQRQRIMGYG